MKTLADIKRRAVVGQKIQLTYHWIDDATAPLKTSMVRSVQKVQSNAIQFSPIPGRESGSWLFWPKAGDIKIVSDDEFYVYEGEKACMGYKFV